MEKKQKKQELQEVSNWDILKLRSQMKLASKMHQYISTLPVFLSFMKFCVSQTSFVERHLDVVVEFIFTKEK